MKTVKEMKTAIEFGKDLIKEMNERNEQIPVFVYERMIEVMSEYIEAMEGARDVQRI